MGWFPPRFGISCQRSTCTVLSCINCARSQSGLETVEEQAEPTDTDEKDEKPEPLSEKQLNEVPIAIEVFSMELVCLHTCQCSL